MKIFRSREWAAVAVAVAGIAMTGCGDGKKSEKQPPVYPVMTVEAADRMLHTHYAASLTGCQTVEVRPQIEGMLTRICIREGDEVHRGQTLFEIDPAQFRAAYEIAEANVHSAEASVSTAQLVYESNKELYDEKVISEFELNTAKNELDEAHARLKLAKAELDKAATNLSYTQVKSPVNGVASMIPYRVGALVGTNIARPLVTVSDDHEVYAYFSMAENQMLDLTARFGSLKNAIDSMPQVDLLMSNGALYPEKGHIDAVSGTINSSTGTVGFRAVFPNGSHLLRDGGSGTVSLPVVRRGSIVIPQGATYELQDKVFVYKVIDGKAVSHEVQVLDLNNGKEYVVTSGLEVGDVIVSEGAGLVKEGAEVGGGNADGAKKEEGKR